MTLRQPGNEGRVSFTYLIGQSVGAEVTQRQLEFLQLLVDGDLDGDERVGRGTPTRVWCRHAVREVCRGVRLLWRYDVLLSVGGDKIYRSGRLDAADDGIGYLFRSRGDGDISR